MNKTVPAVSDEMVEAACRAVVLGEDERGCSVYLTPNEARDAISAALAAQGQEPVAVIQPRETAPSGPDTMVPSQVDVHEGAWAWVIGTNGKKAGWIDTHALFAHQLYRHHPTAALTAPAQPVGVPEEDGQMSPEKIRLEDLKQMAMYAGPIVSFEVSDGYYLASCDKCGWVGSSEHCGKDYWGDDSDVYCPRCSASGADCGKVAERLERAAPQPPAEGGWETDYQIVTMEGEFCAEASSLADAHHYAMVYSQDGPVQIMEICRRPLPPAPANGGEQNG